MTMALVMSCGCGTAQDNSPVEENSFEEYQKEINEQIDAQYYEHLEEQGEEPQTVIPEKVEIKNQNIELMEGEKKEVTIIVTPNDADTLGLSAKSVSGKTEVYTFSNTLKIEAIEQGSDQVEIYYDNNLMYTLDVEIEKKYYTTSNMDTGNYYSDGDKIYKFNVDDVNIYGYYHFGYRDRPWGIMDADDYSEDVFPHVKRGEYLYGKNTTEWQLFTCNDPKGSVCGYIYDYSLKNVMEEIKPLSISEQYNSYSRSDMVYVNDQEIEAWRYFKDYFGEYDYDDIYDIAQSKKLSKGDTVTLGYFEGTTYKTLTLTANLWFMSAVHAFSTDDFELSKDGYEYFQIPETFEPGFYCINNREITNSDPRNRGSSVFWFYLE